jgi:hypothetical protein
MVICGVKIKNKSNAGNPATYDVTCGENDANAAGANAGNPGANADQQELTNAKAAMNSAAEEYNKATSDGSIVSQTVRGGMKKVQDATADVHKVAAIIVTSKSNLNYVTDKQKLAAKKAALKKAYNELEYAKAAPLTVLPTAASATAASSATAAAAGSTPFSAAAPAPAPAPRANAAGTSAPGSATASVPAPATAATATDPASSAAALAAGSSTSATGSASALVPAHSTTAATSDVVIDKKEAIKRVLLNANNAIEAIDTALNMLNTSNNNANTIDMGKQLLREGTAQVMDAALAATTLFPFSESSPPASLNVYAHNMNIDANQMVTHVHDMNSFKTLTTLQPKMLEYIASFENFIDDTQHALISTQSFGGRRTHSLRKNRRTHSKGKRTKRTKRTKRSKHTKRNKRSKHTKRKQTK